MKDTQTKEYAQYLINHQKSWKGKLFQIPYQTHLRLLSTQKTLDIGCGAGRNLNSLSADSIGVDHNAIMIESCKERGLNAFTKEQWDEEKQKHIGSFDTILFSHVAEHMNQADFQMLLGSMLNLLKPEGRILIICPQEAGYKTDKTHVEFMDFKKIDSIFKNLKIRTERQYSFPFTRKFGTFFPYNEFISIGRKMK
jgi:2-polyprenyl-3-methyl-5-hydroxy-6-metoxy-1,4-benzoquinol methylase